MVLATLETPPVADCNLFLRQRSRAIDALVLRVYESEGARGAIEISGELDIARWNRTDLLEEKSEPLPRGSVAYGPFAVITLTGIAERRRSSV